MSWSPSADSDNFLDIYYPSIKLVWFSTLWDPTYGWKGVSIGGERNFYHSTTDRENRWKRDLEERFIRSMLRVRHMSRIAAERDLLYSRPRDPHGGMSFHYRSADYTNVNIWGTFAVIGGYAYLIAGSYWLVLLSPFAYTTKL
jgi:hypothetical protein